MDMELMSMNCETMIWRTLKSNNNNGIIIITIIIIK